MLDSETFGFAIARPCQEIYEFLLEPTNFAKWAFVGDVAMRHLGGRDWAVETSIGPRIIRFAERNDLGVLDHAALRHAGDAPHPTGMWLVENGAGSELIYTNYRRPGMGDTEWASLKTWLVTDLLALQSLLEARGRLEPMLPVQLASYRIERPAGEVYAFLQGPQNFDKWAFAGDAEMRRIGGGEWAVETSVGPRIIRFAEPNMLGVLTYYSRLGPGLPAHPIPMRVAANGEGTELSYVFLKRPELADDEWASLIEWVKADLEALKSLLETR
jgi:hypothetical protein